MPATTVEERLSALEADVAWLKAYFDGGRPGVIGRTRPDFLERCFGMYADSPLAEEVQREIEAEREREREEARRLDTDSSDDSGSAE